MGIGQAKVKLSLDWKGCASTTHTLRVINGAGGQPLPVSSRLIRSLPYPDRKTGVACVCFTPKGTLFVAGGYPRSMVQLWDVATGKELRRIEGASSYSSNEHPRTPADFSILYVPVQRVTVHHTPSDPKTRFTVEIDGQILVWDLDAGTQRPAIKPPPGYGVAAVQVSPDGKRLLTVERSGYAAGSASPPDRIRLYDAASQRSWDLGEGSGRAAVPPDSRRIYLTRTMSFPTQNSSLVVFDSDGKQLATLAQIKGAFFGWPVLSPDGKRLAVSAGKAVKDQPATLKVFDTATGKEVAAFPSVGNFIFNKPTFSPDGRFLAATDNNEQVTIWDVAKKTIVRKQRFEGRGMVSTPAFSPDGTRLAVPAWVKTENARALDSDPLDFPQPRVYLLDLTREGAPEEIVCPHGWPGGVAFSTDGKMLAAGGAGAVHLFDVSRGRKR